MLMVLLLCGIIVALVCLERWRSLKKKYSLAETGTSPRGMGYSFSHDHEDFDGFIQRLQEMIRIPTVSWTDHAKRDNSQFTLFQDTLVRLYPRVHETMDVTRLDEFGLIYHWKGSDSQKKPVLFLAHYDVVPAEEEGNESWQEDPFGAAIKSNVLWGRGTLDIKTQLAFQLETAEQLLARNWTPERDIWFAFGGDEEISGQDGAGKIAARFKEQGLEFEFVVDEGGVIAKDQLAFLKGRPAALVGMAEKGFTTFRLTATGESGHSSMPPREGTAMGRLSRAIARLESHPFPTRLDPVMSNMLERFVPCVSFPLGILFANLWLFSPLIRYFFSKNKTTDSLIRTTQAVTVARCGEQENILPSEAWCLVNHRILPGDCIDSVGQRHMKTIRDKGISIERAGNWRSNNPIPASDLNASGFRLIQEVLAISHPGVVPVPFLVNGSTDSKYYCELTAQILRFTPLVMTPEDLAGIHGVNEKVSLDNLKQGLFFYEQFFIHL